MTLGAVGAKARHFALPRLEPESGRRFQEVPLFVE
jgi:hypothetical protein